MLKALGDKYSCDKISLHGYHRFYELLLQPLRDRDILLLEIGIHKGASLNMWLEFFPRGKVYGIDIDVSGQGDRYKIYKGSQDNELFMQEVLQDIGAKLDIIIDDGSHLPDHQIKTFNMLFPNLKDGGIYIIEDIETSYWTNGGLYGYEYRYGYRHPKSTIEIFKNLIDVINIEYLTPPIIRMLGNMDIPIEIAVAIKSIQFAQNCIIITKKDEEDIPFSNRPYRIGHFL